MNAAIKNRAEIVFLMNAATSLFNYYLPAVNRKACWALTVNHLPKNCHDPTSRRQELVSRQAHHPESSASSPNHPARVLGLVVGVAARLLVVVAAVLAAGEAEPAEHSPLREPLRSRRASPAYQ